MLKMKRTTEIRIAEIKENLGIEKYSMKDFWLASPYSEEKVKEKTRKTEICTVRQVGVVWSVLAGNTLSDTGREFGLKHCAVFHSVNLFKNVIEFPKSHPDMYQLILKTCSISQSAVDISHSQLVNQLRAMDLLIAPVLEIGSISLKAAVSITSKQSFHLGLS